jgi:hypothetical protein
MAARKRKVQLTDAWKEKIRISVISGRLYDHVNGEIEMSNTQIKAAQILLAKLVPDLGRTEVSGVDGGPVETITRIELAAMSGNSKA